MDLPEELKKEYTQMLADLTEYAKSLGLDPNKLAEEADKFASEMASQSDENSLYKDKPRLLRVIISFGSAVEKEINRQIDNGLYRIELTDMRVDRKGYIYDRRVRRVSMIVSLCDAELLDLVAPARQW